MRRVYTLVVLLALLSPLPAEALPTLPAECKEFPGSIFKPCTCVEDIPKQIKYRPSLPECDGDAAAILIGPWASIYSIVLRDSQNRDRWPLPGSGYGGCSFELANSDDPPKRCSAFKAARVLRKRKSSISKRPQRIFCFGEPGTSNILEPATRMTIKIRDIPGSNLDPIVRLCLPDFDPDKPLN